jgi:hypothetical protein
MTDESRRVVECGGCGLTLDVPLDEPPEKRAPCPKCGSTQRSVFASLSTTITASASVTAEVTVIRAPEAVSERTGELAVETGRQLTWYRYRDGMFLVLVHDDAGNLIAAGGGNDPEEALLEVAERLLPRAEP